MHDRSKGKKHSKALTQIKKSEMLMNIRGAAAHKFAKLGLPSVLAEIDFLSSQNRSCLVTIKNQTQSNIKFRKAFILRGFQPTYHGFDQGIPSNDEHSYTFERQPRSLTGCAAMIVFSTETTKQQQPTECFFLVAFRNYVIQLIKPNKAVLMILSNEGPTEELLNYQQFSSIMANTSKKPITLKCAYKLSDSKKFFAFNETSQSSDDLDFGSLMFEITSYNVDYHNQIIVIVKEHKEQ